MPFTYLWGTSFLRGGDAPARRSWSMWSENGPRVTCQLGTGRVVSHSMGQIFIQFAVKEAEVLSDLPLVG